MRKSPNSRFQVPRKAERRKIQNGPLSDQGFAWKIWPLAHPWKLEPGSWFLNGRHGGIAVSDKALAKSWKSALQQFIHRCTLIILILPLAPARANCAEAPDARPTLLSTTGGKTGEHWNNLASLQKAAEAGNPKACLQLGLCYEAGENVGQDYGQAQALYEKAAAAGSADAIYHLGKLNQEGLGVEPDPIRAHNLYEEAALADVPLAQYDLGVMLVGAHGVKRDFVEGLAWLILASRNHVEADGEQRVRTHLAGQPQVIAAAEKRAEELLKDVAAHRGTGPVWPLPVVDSSPPVQLPAPVKPMLPPPKLEPPKIELPPPPIFPPPSAPGAGRP
jgi:uncharacterized protein